MEKSSITKNFFFNILLTLSTYIAQLVVYPYVSRVLGVDNMGIIGFVNKTIDIFLIFSTLGISIVGIREVASVKKDRGALDKVFSSLVTFILISTVLVSIIYLLAILWVTKFNIYSNLFLIGLSKLIFSTFLIEWFYQGIENFKFITIRSLIVKVLYIISVFLFVRDNEDTWIYFFLTTAVVVLNSVLNWAYSRKLVRFKLDFSGVKLFIKPMLIYGMYQLLNATFSTFNYLFLGFITTPKELGYYYTSENFYGILLALISAFTRVMLPRMSFLLADGKENEFKRMIEKSFDVVLSICLPISIFGIFFASGLVNLFSGTGYEGAVLPLQIMMVLVLINSINQILIIQVATPLKLDREILIGTAVATVIALTANYFMTKYWGAVGCSMVLVISVIIANLYPIYCLIKKKGFKLPIKVMSRQLFFALPYIVISFVAILLGRSNIIITMIIAAVCYGAYYMLVPGRSFVLEYSSRLIGKR